jgi:hypothetical protein
MPYRALQSLGPTGKALIEFNGVTATETCRDGDGLLEPGEGGTPTINLKDTVLANATKRKGRRNLFLATSIRKWLPTLDTLRNFFQIASTEMLTVFQMVPDVRL